MKIKVSEATPLQLNWMVAKCEGKIETGPYGCPWVNNGELHLHYCDVILLHTYDPSTNWAEGGPIIEREDMDVGTSTHGGWRAVLATEPEYTYGEGPTPLIAAMRCYVASKLGDEVDVPEELK